MKTDPDTQRLPYGFTALLAALLISALTLAPRADASGHGHIYWTTSSGDIGRANLDGTGVNRHFIRGAAVSPSAIAVYGHHIYWTDTNRDTIGRANLNGTGVNRTFLSFPGSSLFRPHDVVIGGGYIYWANWNAFIGRAKLNGTHAQFKFISLKGFALGYLAVNARHIYWTGIGFEEPNVIGRANLNGTRVNNTFIRSETSPFHLTVGSGHLYWTTPTSAIVRANLDGTGVRPKFIISDKAQPGGIAVGGGHVYWTGVAHSSTNPAEDTLLGWIGRANLDDRSVHWMAAGSDEETPTDVAVSQSG
jgi:hypothetical protein